MGTVDVKVCERDFFGMNDTARFTCRTHASRSEELNLGKGVQSQRWF